MVFFMRAGAASTVVKAMTYNVDEGTDFDAIVSVLSNPNATAADFQAAIVQTMEEVLSTNPLPRAQLISDVISSRQPDLVGLQEAAVWTFGNARLDLLQMHGARLIRTSQAGRNVWALTLRATTLGHQTMQP